MKKDVQNCLVWPSLLNVSSWPLWIVSTVTVCHICRSFVHLLIFIVFVGLNAISTLFQLLVIHLNCILWCPLSRTNPVFKHCKYKCYCQHLYLKKWSKIHFAAYNVVHPEINPSAFCLKVWQPNHWATLYGRLLIYWTCVNVVYCVAGSYIGISDVCMPISLSFCHT